MSARSIAPTAAPRAAHLSRPGRRAVLAITEPEERKRIMSHAAIPSPAATVPRTRGRSIPTLAETTKIVTYGATLTGIYLSVGFVFYYAMKEKLFTDGGTMPKSLQKLFAGSFFAGIPGDNAAWVLLGLSGSLDRGPAARQPAARRVPSPAPQADPAHRPARSHCLPSGSWASPIT